tara:strand:+ start:1131 stop:1556 length:426 start_codon:yes stop_codon:yes gene_type:complete
MNWFDILKKPTWYEGSSPYKPRKDKRFQYMRDLTPEWDDILTWESKDKNARGEAVYHEPDINDEDRRYFWDIRIFTIKDNMQNKGKARTYLQEFIDELNSLEHTNSLPTVSKIQNNTLEFWRKMKDEGLVSKLYIQEKGEV